MWGQNSLFNIRYKIYAFFIQLYVTKGGQILTKGHINFFFKELNILLQSTKEKPGYSCSLKCEFKN